MALQHPRVIELNYSLIYNVFTAATKTFDMSSAVQQVQILQMLWFLKMVQILTRQHLNTDAATTVGDLVTQITEVIKVIAMQVVRTL